MRRFVILGEKDSLVLLKGEKKKKIMSKMKFREFLLCACPWFDCCPAPCCFLPLSSQEDHEVMQTLKISDFSVECRLYFSLNVSQQWNYVLFIS